MLQIQKPSRRRHGQVSVLRETAGLRNPYHIITVIRVCCRRMECQLIMVHFLWWWPSAIRLILLWSESLSLGLCFFTDQGHAMPVEIETEGGSWVSFLSPAEIHPPRINKKPTHTQPISKCLWQFGPKMNREFESPAPFHCITFLSRCDSPPGTNEDYRRYLLLLSLSMSCPAVVSIQRSSCLLLSASPVLKKQSTVPDFLQCLTGRACETTTTGWRRRRCW